jgi:hypothetical protein
MCYDEMREKWRRDYCRLTLKTIEFTVFSLIFRILKSLKYHRVFAIFKTRNISEKTINSIVRNKSYRYIY